MAVVIQSENRSLRHPAQILATDYAVLRGGMWSRFFNPGNDVGDLILIDLSFAKIFLLKLLFSI